MEPDALQLEEYLLEQAEDDLTGTQADDWEETQEGWTWKVYSLLYAPQLQEEIYLSIHGWRYPLRDMPHTIQAWALDLIDLLYRERCAKETYLRRKDGP